MLPNPHDHVAISNLLARYCLTLDLDDVDGWRIASCRCRFITRTASRTACPAKSL
jgi:hypothetical protein